MNDLKNVTKLVKTILENEPETRNSDDLLYLFVLQSVSPINLCYVNVVGFLAGFRSKNKLPPFESVRRARQKLQAAHPELAPCEEIAQLRSENEMIFRSYALGVEE